MVIEEIGRQPEQAGRLRSEFEPCGVGTPDDQRQGIKGRILDLVDPQKSVEAANAGVRRTSSMSGALAVPMDAYRSSGEIEIARPIVALLASRVVQSLGGTPDGGSARPRKWAI